MERQPKTISSILMGSNHNSTIRDFFENYAASSSESAELADRLPDYLFRRSLTSPDEKFSVSRFVYSTPDVERRFEKKMLLPQQSESQKVCKYSCDSSKPLLGRSMVDEGESMSETEKLFLYRKLLRQNKIEEHPSLVKHRRLMLDFQTRRDIVRADNVVLPISVLHRGTIDGVQGKIVYLRNPMNRIKPASNCDKNHEMSIDHHPKEDTSCNRPKTAPNASFLRNKPTLLTLKASASVNATHFVNGTRRVKSGVNFNSRYRAMMENKQKVKMQMDSVEFDIRNTRSARSGSQSELSLTLDAAIRKETKGLGDAGDVSRRSSGTSDSTTTATEATPSTPRLSLNVFLPREIEEVRRCNLPESHPQTDTLPGTSETIHVADLNKDVIDSAKTTGLISSRYGLSRTTRDLLSKCNEQHSQCARFQYTQANVSKETLSNTAKRAVHSNSIGPGPSQVKTVFRPHRPISPTLRLDGQKSTFI